MSNLSRRSLVASAAALPALAVPAIALEYQSVPISVEIDTWVARLRPEFDRVVELWLRLFALNNDDFWMEYDGDLHLWTALHARLYPVVDEILKQKATTSAGMALLAQATAVKYSEYFGDDGDDDIAEFIESVCTFVGVIPAPLVTMDAAVMAAFTSDLQARLTATPIDKNNRDQIIDDLLAVQS
jgi:hypothetical protein